MRHILITGVAGFIGAALAQRLLANGDRVTGVDTLNDYYDVALKQARLARLEGQERFQWELLDIADRQRLPALFARYSFDVVVNLAAQAGVRHSIQHPMPYIDTNLAGFANILECCRHHSVGHLVYASSSSVYGANPTQPFSERHNVDHPLSLYAATKKANELMAHTYAHLYHLSCTGLRFFTVYGPWMRPDMALYKFALKMAENCPIPVYNHGEMSRDFTYIDDIITGVLRVMEQPAQPDPHWDATAPDSSTAPYRVYNIGNGQKVPLMHYIHLLETHLGIAAQVEFLPMQPGDVPVTWADTASLQTAVGYAPATPVATGVAKFAEWFKEYHANLLTSHPTARQV